VCVFKWWKILNAVGVFLSFKNKNDLFSFNNVSGRCYTIQQNGAFKLRGRRVEPYKTQRIEK
jgi:hypothetical protein